MNFFKPVEQNLPGWLEENSIYSDIIISSRARIARNIKGYPYYTKITQRKAEEIIEFINNAIKNIEDLSKKIFLINLNFLPLESKKFLKERFLATDYLIKGTNKEIIAEKKERFAILINEEDHLRIQSISGGFSIKKVYKTASDIENKLENYIEYDFMEEFGYLTACPTNTGTGLRISVMMHLPALSYTKKIKPLFSSLSEMGLSIRGFYGEGSDSIGSMFQISNQYTLGVSEKEIIEKIERIVKEIYNIEKEARNKLIKNNSQSILNKVRRAVNILQYSDSLEINEALELLSDLRLGVTLQIIDSLDFKKLNKLLILIQPMHLLNIYNISPEGFTKEAENRLRATIIRKYLYHPVRRIL